MKIVRWWGLAAFLITLLLITLAWYFIAPMVIKSGIEKTGTEALGAKVDVAQVDLHLFPLGITVNGIEVTDPDQPMTNLFEIGTVTFAIDTSKLLWQKVFIDELVVTGVELATKRKTSGLVSTEDKVIAEGENSTNSNLPELTKDDIKRIIDDADLLTLKNIELLKAKQDSLKAFWQKEIENTQHETVLKAIESEFSRLSKRAKKNSINLIKDRKAWKKLKKDISREKKLISELNRRLKTDRKDLAQKIIDVKNSPQKDLDNLLSKTGLNGGLSGMAKEISNQLIGSQFTPWIEKILAFSNKNKSIGEKATSVETVAYETSKGPMIQFEDHQLFPKLFIRKISLSGKDNKWNISGEANDIGYYPWIISKPADLTVDLANLSNNGKASLFAKSEWQTSTQMNSEIQSKVDDWNIHNMRLLQNESGNWMIDSGRLNASLVGKITLEYIDLQLNMAISKANIVPPSKLSGWQRDLAKSLKNQKSVSISITVTGDLNEPKMEIDTNLEKIFSSAIGNSIKEKTAKYKDKYKAEIAERVGDLSKLDGMSEDFEKWTEKLKSNDKLLEKINLDL